MPTHSNDVNLQYHRMISFHNVRTCIYIDCYSNLKTVPLLRGPITDFWWEARPTFLSESWVQYLWRTVDVSSVGIHTRHDTACLWNWDSFQKNPFASPPAVPSLATTHTHTSLYEKIPSYWQCFVKRSNYFCDMLLRNDILPCYLYYFLSVLLNLNSWTTCVNIVLRQV